jgi:tetratricopeptide (TPR) repeat protein
MANYFWVTGDQDRAIESGQRALAIATARADVMLQIETDFYLGQAHHALGDYRRAMDILRRTLNALEGDLNRRRFGVFYTATCRVWLVWCLAETGAFAEGLMLAQEMLRTAEAADNLVSHYGPVRLRLPVSRQNQPGHCCVRRGLALCESEISLWLPWLLRCWALPTSFGRLDERCRCWSGRWNERNHDIMAAHALL